MVNRVWSFSTRKSRGSTSSAPATRECRAIRDGQSPQDSRLPHLGSGERLGVLACRLSMRSFLAPSPFVERRIQIHEHDSGTCLIQCLSHASEHTHPARQSRAATQPKHSKHITRSLSITLAAATPRLRPSPLPGRHRRRCRRHCYWPTEYYCCRHRHHCRRRRRRRRYWRSRCAASSSRGEQRTRPAAARRPSLCRREWAAP